jgi:hypothetical protein
MGVLVGYAERLFTQPLTEIDMFPRKLPFCLITRDLQLFQAVENPAQEIEVGERVDRPGGRGLERDAASPLRQRRCGWHGVTASRWIGLGGDRVLAGRCRFARRAGHAASVSWRQQPGSLGHLLCWPAGALRLGDAFVASFAGRARRS